MTHVKPKADLVFKVVKDGPEPSFYITFANAKPESFDLTPISRQIQTALSDKGAQTSPASLITLIRFPALNDRIIANSPEAYGRWIADNTSTIKTALQQVVRNNADQIDLDLKVGIGQGRSQA